MIKTSKQQVLLDLFEQNVLRVTAQGVVEQFRVGRREWEPVSTYVRKGAPGTPVFKRVIRGTAHELPVAAASLLWRLRRTVSPELYIGYEDGDRSNLAPENVCLVTKAEAYGARYNKDGTRKA